MGSGNSQEICIDVVTPRRIRQIAHGGISELLDFAAKQKSKRPSHELYPNDEEYASTTICLSALDTIKATSIMASALLEEQLVSCWFDDDSVNVFKSRVEVLKSAQKIMVPIRGTNHTHVRASHILERTQAELHVGIETASMLLTYINSFRDNNRRVSFLDEIVSLLCELKSLQLRNIYSRHQIACTSNRSSVILTSMRNFLYCSVMSESIGEVPIYVSWDKQMQLSSIDLLIAFTLARGYPSDLLVMVNSLVRTSTSVSKFAHEANRQRK
mmetsp:Transcript_4361/g.13795  ORF Transcript_4361/g.13795 Transcript_4361/m.13795 type:complete len:271 (-) Transcript_4361:10275-11087(-)